MIDIIIFSKDNPMMLYLTLKSLKKYIPGAKINVLYTCEIEKTKKGYLDLIKTKDLSNLYWHSSTMYAFKDTLLTILTTITTNEVLFLTDGDVLFDNFDSSIIERNLLNEDVLCHSLRLGVNVTVCNRMKCENVIKADEIEAENNSIIWDWTKHYLDFGYPFSLHGHVFRVKEIKKLIKKTTFNNHESLEDGLQMFEHFPKKKMTAFKQSKSFFVLYDPENISIEDFLSGYRPDLESLDFTNEKKCEGEKYFESIKIA